MASFASWQLSDVTFTGTPFDSNATADSGSVGTTFTITSGATATVVSLTDNDPNFEDADGGQDLSSDVTMNGTLYTAGTTLETEYSYVVRPVGSTDPAEEVRIYSLEFAGLVEGFISDGWLQPGVDYEIIAVDSNDPVLPYASAYVCFRAGTLIETAAGAMPVEAIGEGVKLQTFDNGLQPVIWRGEAKVRGVGPAAPVRIAAGVLGARRPLFVSAQHRLEVGGQLVAAKALIGQPGITQVTLPALRYVHLLCAGHEIVLADGVAAETFNPGPMALEILDAGDAAVIETEFALASDELALAPARPIIRPGRWIREVGRLPSSL